MRPIVGSALWAVLLVSGGCASLSYGERGALLGGLGGAGVGALIGEASGQPGAGALIGGGVGALTGGVVGSAIDEVDAKNRARIEQQLGRQLAAGGVTVNDVVAMVESGVDPDLVVNHIRSNGMQRPLQANELITLQQQNIPKHVIAAMQTTPVASPAAAAGPVTYAAAAPQTIVIQEPCYGPPPVIIHHRRPCGPRVGWGMSFSNF